MGAACWLCPLHLRRHAEWAPASTQPAGAPISDDPASRPVQKERLLPSRLTGKRKESSNNNSYWAPAGSQAVVLSSQQTGPRISRM